MDLTEMVINLNNCASTKPYEQIIELHSKLAQEYYYNSNAMSKFEHQTNNLLIAAQNKIKKLLSYQGDVVFTSGATMSNNMIIQGFFKNNVNRIKQVITSNVEHPSISHVVQNLPDFVSKKFVICNLNHDLDLVNLEQQLMKEPSLVTLCLVNNTTGNIVDYKKIYHLCQKYHSYLHLDVTQAIAKIDFDYRYCDFMSMSMHKIGGLKGCGLLLTNNKAKLEPLYYGGESNNILTPGTTNVPLFATAAKTLELALNDFKTAQNTVKKNYDYVIKRLSSNANICLNQHQNNSAFIINFTLLKLRSEIILNYLQDFNILVASGSACSSKKQNESELILNNFNFKHTKNSIRICFNYTTNIEDIMFFIDKLEEGLDTI